MVAVGALALIGGAVALLGMIGDPDDARDVAGGAPPDVSTPGMGTDATAGLTTPLGGRGWVRAEVALTGMESTSGDAPAAIHAVARGGPGWVAVGGDGRDGAIWTSRDARTWNRVAPEAPALAGEGILRLNAVAVGGPGLIAVGWDGYPSAGGETHAVVLTSADGHTWQRAPHDPSVFGGRLSEGGVTIMRTIAPTARGFVAAGQAPSPENPSDGDAAVWTSEDGTTWSRVPADDRVFGGVGTQGVWALIADGPTILGVGNDGMLQFSDGGPETWISADGTDWRRSGMREPVDAGMFDAVAYGDGFVAVGGEFDNSPSTAAAWYSDDGEAWARGVLPEAGAPGNLAAVAAAGDDLLAVGADPRSGRAVVWRSTDGMTWLEHPGPAATSTSTPTQELNDVAIADDMVVVAGRDSSGPAVWLLTP